MENAPCKTSDFQKEPGEPTAPTILVRVYHAYYGCETGCCGHRVELTLPDGSTRSRFEFEHPWDYAPENFKVWARKQAGETIRERWPECIESIDWASMVVEASDD